MSQIVIRHAIPADAAALTRMYSQPEPQTNTLHLPSTRDGKMVDTIIWRV